MGELLQGALVALLALAVVGFAGVGLLRRSRTFVLVGGVLGATLLMVASGFPTEVQAPWRGVIRYGVIAAMAAFLWVALTQEPEWLARRLGFIRRSEEWEYDVILSGLVNELNETVAAAKALRPSRQNGQPVPEARHRLRADAERILSRLRSTPTPDDTWAELAAMYGDLIALHITHLGQPISSEVERQFLELNARATARREDLRAAYRAHARSAFRWP